MYSFQYRLISCYVLLLISLAVYAQSGKESFAGRVVDTETYQPVSFATIRLLSLPDSTLLVGGATDINGKFQLSFIRKTPNKSLLLHVSFVGYKPVYQLVFNSQKTVSAHLGDISLTPESYALDETVVVGQAPMVITEGDTTVFNASAYRTPEGSMLEELVKQLPGGEIDADGKLLIHGKEVKKILEDAGVGYIKLGKPTDERHILVSKDGATYQFGIDYMRDVWYSSSYLLDRKQSMNGCAKKRFENYKMQPVEFAFMPGFKGKLSQYGITPDRRTPSGIRAAIIREKGTNGEREMAYSLYLAGFDVKDVTMTDLISGRETLEDVNMIVYCGGFSNSDVLGSAKGWAGGFLFNPKAKEALDKFYAREDTLSLGICNGCQLMMELGLINPEHEKKGKMLHNDSHKFESTYVGLTIPTNRSVMFGSLSGSKLGIWVAHGEGKFSLPYDEDQYNVVAKYSYDEYPGNPNGSDYSIAGLASADGRHLAMMPHLERAIFPWQNGCYPADRKNSDQITPWIEAFVNARRWVEEKTK